MKKIFFYILALCPLMAAAQGGTFTIKAQVGHLNAPAKAFLLYQLGANKVLDSAAITNGSFTFTGTLLNPVGAVIVMDPKGAGFEKLSQTADNLNLYLENGQINITGPDSIARAQITGSAINDDNKKLSAQLAVVNAKAKKVVDAANAAPAEEQKTAEFQNSIQAKLKVLQNEQQGVLKNFIAANPKSYLSLLAISSLGGPSPDAAMMEQLYTGLDQSIKDTEAGRSIKISIEELKATAVGAFAPDFTQNDVNGVPVKLSSFKGKYVLIDFWASWCGPCRQENPNVVKAYNKYKAKNFTILGVSLDRPDGKADWLAAIKADGLAWTQVSDLQFWSNSVAALYFVRSIPQNFLIDPNGKIIAKNLRGDDLENKLTEIFGKI